MTHKVKDLSPDQKMAIESLLGRSIAENEEITIRKATSPSVPDGFSPLGNPRKNRDWINSRRTRLTRR